MPATKTLQCASGILGGKTWPQSKEVEIRAGGGHCQRSHDRLAKKELGHAGLLSAQCHPRKQSWGGVGPTYRLHPLSPFPCLVCGRIAATTRSETRVVPSGEKEWSREGRPAVDAAWREKRMA